MDHDEMRRRVTDARVARVATFGEKSIHVVPIVFVLDDDTLYSSTDASPRPKRLENIERDPRVSVVVDHYEEEWPKVWWVRLTGKGRVLEDGSERDHALRLLAEKYPQFEGDPAGGPVMAIDIKSWAGWGYRGLGTSTAES